MKRVGGQVTWLCEFDRERSDLAARGIKQQTLRRCHIVEAGDTLRLSTGGAEGVFAEVVVRKVTPIVIRCVPFASNPEFYVCMVGSQQIDEIQFESLARNDGFECGRHLIKWLSDHGKFFNNEYDGQLIEW